MGSIGSVEKQIAADISPFKSRLGGFWCLRIPFLVSLLFLMVFGAFCWWICHERDAYADNAPIAVSSISPDNGPIAGGTKITIEGSGFWGEYEQVEYIYFDGKSYIQTDATQVGRNLNVRIKPDAYDSKIRFVAGAANNSGLQVFGIAREGSTGQTYRFYTGSTTVSTSNSLTTTNAATPATGMVDIAFDWTRQAHINGSQWPNSTTTYVGAAVPTVAETYQIGGVNSYSSEAQENFFKGRFYQMKLTNAVTGELEHHFVPVRKKGTEIYGVVDLITGKDYLNASTIVGSAITGGTPVVGALAPDKPISVEINGRTCTGVEILSDTTLTCHTPTGLGREKVDVVVSNGVDANDAVTVIEGYEYALRLNSVSPKYSEPEPATPKEITIEGGIFSTPPDSYVSASVSGIHFDGDSWIATGFDQIGSTSFAIDYTLSTTPQYNSGFLGSRSTGSTGSFLIWQLAAGNFRHDYGASNGTTFKYNATTGANALLGVRSQSLIDDGYVSVNGAQQSDRAKINFSSLLPAEMLLGSITTGSGYGTNSFTPYKNFVGEIFSAQICKEKTIADNTGIIYQESSLCDGPADSERNASRPQRVLVRDLQAAIRTSDNVCGFYDMVTGEFLTNVGYGSLSCVPDAAEESTLEVPVDLEVMFVDSNGDPFVDEHNNIISECTDAYVLRIVLDDDGNPVLDNNGNEIPYLVGDKIRCTAPPSPFRDENGDYTNGKVDVMVTADGVPAIPGAIDADDFYYGAPMIIERISPIRGSTSGGTLVTITGNNFFPDDFPDLHDPLTSWQDIKIYIGGEYDPLTGILTGGAACNFRLNGAEDGLADPNDYTNTTLKCTTTARASGISDVYVENWEWVEDENNLGNYIYQIREHYNYGGSVDPITGAITSGYLYEEDLISVSPNVGPTTGGTNVTILGSGNFDTTTPGLVTSVYFGGVAATNVSVVSGNTIVARTPPHAPGVVDIVVYQGQGDDLGGDLAASLKGSALNAFEYEVAESSAFTFSPNSGYTTGGDIVTIGGTFDDNILANNTIVTFNQVAATILSVSTTEIVVEIPASTAGRADVSVSQWGTEVGTSRAFSYIPPLSITSISPDRGPLGGGTRVTITGESFLPPEYTAATAQALNNLEVWFGSGLDAVPCLVEDAIDYTNTQIVCTTSEYQAGSGVVDVSVSVGQGANRNDTSAGALDPITGDVLGGFMYVNARLTLGTSTVEFSLAPGTWHADKTGLTVETDNQNGYSLSIRADDGDALTNDDDWLKCNILGSSDKIQSLSTAGALTTNSWGWSIQSGINTTTPTTWRPISLTNASMIAPVNDPTGAGGDKYELWFGASVDVAQRPCVYEATVVISLVVQ